MSEDFERKLTAILSADAVGYSRLMGDDEAATVRTLTAHMEAISDLVVHHRGRVVDSPGDNVLAEFASVVDAVECALEVQTVLGERNAALPEDRSMPFRIGVNLGDVIVEGDKLYGDGVNIAARLEGLAEPGGICISGTVYEHIRNKLTLWDEYLGEHSVKNIADAVKVYRLLLKPREGKAPKQPPEPSLQAPRRLALHRPRVNLSAAVALIVVLAGYVGWQLLGHEGADGPAPAMAVDDGRPRIAVLAFDNMSDDPAQEYFSDGISEDLITDLAKISGLRVTARNTTFAYKSQAVDIAAVGQELGVAYVVEGSVRRADGRIRINAQLIRTETGEHVWAERYDRAVEDVFDVQDEVVAKIVEALRVTLTGEEEALLTAQATDNLEAYNQAKQGWWYYHRFNVEDNQRARALFEEAIQADPEYAHAMTGLGFTYYEAWAQFWDPDPAGLEMAGELARESLALDSTSPAAYTLLSHAYLWTHQHDQAVDALETALALDPNDPWTQRDMAEVLLYVGRAEEAVEYARRAMELEPHHAASFPFTLAFAYHLLERHEEAIANAEEALELNPLYMPAMLLLAGSHIALGHQAEAERYAALALASNPQLTVDLLEARMPFADPSLWQTRAAMMRRAGIP